MSVMRERARRKAKKEAMRRYTDWYEAASGRGSLSDVQRDYLAWHLKRELAKVMPPPPEGSNETEHLTSERAILRRFFENGVLVGDDTLEALAQAAIEWALAADLPTLLARAKPVRAALSASAEPEGGEGR